MATTQELYTLCINDSESQIFVHLFYQYGTPVDLGGKIPKSNQLGTITIVGLLKFGQIKLNNMFIINL